MGTTIKWYPGPTVAEEITSLTGLLSAIQTQVLTRLKVTAFGYGESGTPPWRAGFGAWTYAANAGQPYLQQAWDDSIATNYVDFRIRYSAALTGMLDPGWWFPGVFLALSANSQADWNYIHQVYNQRLTSHLTGTLYSAVQSAGLCRSSITNSYLGARMYYYGARVGQPWGLEIVGSYNPTQAEREGDPPIKNSHWSLIVPCADPDDGTLNILEGQAELGSVVKGYPQPITTGSEGQASWTELADGVDTLDPRLQDLKDSIDNAFPVWMGNYPEVPDFFTKTPKAWTAVGDPDAVTHPDAQAGDPYTPAVVSPPASVFATGTALPVVLATPSLIATLSKPVAIKVASLAATGIAFATMTSSGVLTKVANAAQALLDTVFDSLVNLSDWFQSPDSPPAQIRDALDQGNITSSAALEVMERIAVALEKIAVELCRDPEDPITHQGIVNAVELASQARSEITLRSHGMLCTASTGVVIEEDPEP